MELNDTYDLEMLKSDLKSIAHEYKAGDVALQYIAQLEADIGECSVCGTRPALLVDRKHKGTYWKCADCMMETIEDKMQLEAENSRAMDAMFPNGWKPEDAMALGQTVEGMCEQLDKAVAWFEGDDSPRARLEAEVAKWERIANEEHAQSASIAMLNGKLEAENERLRARLHRAECMDLDCEICDALKAGDD